MERSARNRTGLLAHKASCKKPRTATLAWESPQQSPSLLHLQCAVADKAEASYRAEIAADPMNSSAHCELGLLLVVEPRRNIDGAEAAFRAAIAADASNGRALLGLGTLLIKERRDVDGAEAAFRAALCADPADEGSGAQPGGSSRQGAK